ncbi:MAG: hypothetical protein U0353_02865 [Sandaracinus sp.]
MLVDEDRILREIRRLSEVVARAVGLRTPEAQEEADGALGELHRSLFGLETSATRRLHPSSLAAMVSPHQRAAAIELLRADAALLEARGDEGLAALRHAQADMLASA